MWIVLLATPPPPIPVLSGKVHHNPITAGQAASLKVKALEVKILSAFCGRVFSPIGQQNDAGKDETLLLSLLSSCAQATGNPLKTSTFWAWMRCRSTFVGLQEEYCHNSVCKRLASITPDHLFSMEDAFLRLVCFKWCVPTSGCCSSSFYISSFSSLSSSSLRSALVQFPPKKVRSGISIPCASTYEPGILASSALGTSTLVMFRKHTSPD